MKKFEYEITIYPAEDLRNLVYFCTSRGECEQDMSLTNQLGLLKNSMNQKGAEGWELVQLLVGSEGIVALWKRPLDLTAN